MRRSHIRIYQKRSHLAFTLLTILLPFLLLLLFSRSVPITKSELFYAVFVSLLRMIVAYAIAALLGWVLAVSFYRGRRSAAALPIFDVLQSFPTFAALPLAAYAWGVSNTTVIIFLALAIIWPMFFSIVSSLKLVKRDWEEAVEISGLRGYRYLRYFLFPASIPGFVTGSVIGLGDGWEALIATEIIIGTPVGLGNFFQRFSNNSTVTVFGILGYLLLIFVINKLIWLPLIEKSHRRMEE